MDLKSIKAYCKNPKNRSTVNVGLFILLIISFHFIYLGWQALGYWPIGKWIAMLMVWSVDMVYSQSCWVLDKVFHVDITTIRDTRLIAAIDANGNWARVIIAPECASLKQWMHWLFLMLLFPGPWKHKAWYLVAQHPHPPLRQRHQYLQPGTRLCLQSFLLPHHLPHVGTLGGEVLQSVIKSQTT